MIPKRIKYQGQEYKLVESKSINENSYDDDDARQDLIDDAVPQLQDIDRAKNQLSVLVDNARSTIINKHLNSKRTEKYCFDMLSKLQEFRETFVALENEIDYQLRSKNK